MMRAVATCLALLALACEPVPPSDQPEVATDDDPGVTTARIEVGLAVDAGAGVEGSTGEALTK